MGLVSGDTGCGAGAGTAAADGAGVGAECVTAGAGCASAPLAELERQATRPTPATIRRTTAAISSSRGELPGFLPALRSGTPVSAGSGATWRSWWGLGVQACSAGSGTGTATGRVLRAGLDSCSHDGLASGAATGSNASIWSCPRNPAGASAGGAESSGWISGRASASTTGGGSMMTAWRGAETRGEGTMGWGFTSGASDGTITRSLARAGSAAGAPGAGEATRATKGWRGSGAAVGITGVEEGGGVTRWAVFAAPSIGSGRSSSRSPAGGAAGFGAGGLGRLPFSAGLGAVTAGAAGGADPTGTTFTAARGAEAWIGLTAGLVADSAR